MHEKGIEAADIATFNDTNPSVIKVEKS
jgi:hypothetical protein